MPRCINEKLKRFNDANNALVLAKIAAVQARYGLAGELGRTIVTMDAADRTCLLVDLLAGNALPKIAWAVQERLSAREQKEVLAIRNADFIDVDSGLVNSRLS